MLWTNCCSARPSLGRGYSLGGTVATISANTRPGSGQPLGTFNCPRDVQGDKRTGERDGGPGEGESGADEDGTSVSALAQRIPPQGGRSGAGPPCAVPCGTSPTA